MGVNRHSPAILISKGSCVLVQPIITSSIGTSAWGLMTDGRWHNLEHRFSGWEHFMHEPEAFTAWRILCECRGWNKNTPVYGDRGMTLCSDEQEVIERWGVFYEDLSKAKALCTGEIEVIKMWEVSS